MVRVFPLREKNIFILQLNEQEVQTQIGHEHFRHMLEIDAARQIQQPLIRG